MTGNSKIGSSKYVCGKVVQSLLYECESISIDKESYALSIYTHSLLANHSVHRWQIHEGSSIQRALPYPTPRRHHD